MLMKGQVVEPSDALRDLHSALRSGASLDAANVALAEAGAEADFFAPADLFEDASFGDPADRQPSLRGHHDTEADASGSPGSSSQPDARRPTPDACSDTEADASGSPASSSQPDARRLTPDAYSDTEANASGSPFHPLVCLFPAMGEKELNDLANDIREHGLREAIVLAEGMIVDGRNRYLACQRAEVEPRFEEYSGEGSLAAWVISRNLHRRHLDASQRAMVASKLARLEKYSNRYERKVDVPIGTSTPPLITQEEACELLGVGRGSIIRARQVDTHGDRSLVSAVEAGEISVSDAAGIVDQPPEVQRAAVEAKRTGQAKTVRQAAQRIAKKRNPDELTRDDLPQLYRQWEADFGRTIRGLDTIGNIIGSSKYLERVRVGLKLAKAAMEQVRRGR
jgi:ParB-like chromosome segregation protein Spo0J